MLLPGGRASHPLREPGRRVLLRRYRYQCCPLRRRLSDFSSQKIRSQHRVVSSPQRPRAGSQNGFSFLSVTIEVMTCRLKSAWIPPHALRVHCRRPVLSASGSVACLLFTSADADSLMAASAAQNSWRAYW